MGYGIDGHRWLPSVLLWGVVATACSCSRPGPSEGGKAPTTDSPDAPIKWVMPPSTPERAWRVFLQSVTLDGDRNTPDLVQSCTPEVLAGLRPKVRDLLATHASLLRIGQEQPDRLSVAVDQSSAVYRPVLPTPLKLDGQQAVPEIEVRLVKQGERWVVSGFVIGDVRVPVAGK